jgi:uncharacterized protein (TIGR02145 family)
LTNITTSSATAGGTILTDGYAAITKSGIVWSKTSATPTLTDSVIAGTTASGSFTTNLTGLDFNRTYYIRAFATNSVGTAYGDVVTLNTTNDTSKVRFSYNGKEVIYGIIISSASGKKWLDRNLGAARVATSYDDYQAYGDLFQWGRPADGHQLINWTASTTGVPVNGLSNVVANSDTPGHNNFISVSGTPGRDWRSDNNRNRWATIPQGPCPAGWHVPSEADWLAEISKTKGGTANSGGMTDRSTAYSQLKLTLGGYRKGSGADAAQLLQTGTNAHYWMSTDRINLDNYSDALDFEIGADYVQFFFENKNSGLFVRCLMN